MRPSVPRLPSLRTIVLPVVIFAVAFGLLLVARPALAETPTIVVFDGSGSMWGKMAGNETAKFYAARDHLRSLIGQAPPQSRIGFASFGHRRKGDCSDIEVIAPPEAGGAERVIAALDKLNPKGKGPIADGLVAAATAIGQGATGSIILVHDSLDNCQKDVCSAAGSIAKSNPGLAIHVLSLGMTAGEAPRMSCVAKLTRGQHLEAHTEEEIGKALSELFDLAALEPVLPGAAPSPPPQPQADVPSSGPPGLRLTAALAAGGSMIDRPVSWVIRKADAASGTAPLVERKSAEINEPVAPGTYHVAASLGLVTRETTLEVGPQGPTVAALVLDAGTLAITAMASANGQPLSAPVVSVMGKTGDASERAPTPIWIGRDPSTELVVPAGQYEVEVVDGLARKTMAVEVPSGGLGNARLVLETGELSLSAAGHEGGPPLASAMFVLEVDDTDAARGRREIVRSAAANPRFTLVAGTYYVTAILGPNRVRDQVAVSIGDRVQRTIVMNIANVTLDARLVGAENPSAMPIAYRIFETKGSKRLVSRSAAPRPTLSLTAGQYKIEAQLGTTNIKETRLIDVMAGTNVTIDFTLQAAELRPAALPEITSLSASRAVIRDAQGRTVWRARPGAGQVALLSPGRYVLAFDRDERRQERTIEVGSAGPASASGTAGTPLRQPGSPEPKDPKSQR